MIIDIRKANRWRFPRISYTNFRKEYPTMGANCFSAWFSFKRFWGGRIWNFCVKHHQISLDFRMCGWADMAFPNATKQDRKAVDQAVKEQAALRKGER